MANFPPQITRFCDFSGFGPVMDCTSRMLDVFREQWTRPINSQTLRVVLRKGKPKKLPGPWAGALAELEAQFATNSVHHLEWEIFDGEDVQSWRIFPYFDSAARVLLVVNELEAPPSKQMQRRQRTALMQLVTQGTGHVTATLFEVYGSPLMIYCHRLLSTFAARFPKGTPQLLPVKPTVFHDLPQILHHQWPAISAQPPITVKSKHLPTWTEEFEHALGTTVLRERLALSGL